MNRSTEDAEDLAASARLSVLPNAPTNGARDPSADGGIPLPPKLSPKRSRAIAFLVASAFFMENLDGTVISTAMPAMAASFEIPPVDLNVGISAYLLTLGVFIPISGWVADRLGARKVFALAVAVFTLSSILCGACQGLGQFVLARIMQGMGGAMMVPVGRLVVLNNTPKDRLVTAIATLTWPALVSPVLGPPIGGFITVHLGWRWIFYLNVPLGILAMVAAFALIPDGRSADRKPFDWSGFVLCSLGIVGLMYALDLVTREVVNWSHVAIFAAAGIMLLSVAVRHLRGVSNPMINLAAMRVQSFRVTILGGSMFRLSVCSVPFLLPLMFQVGFGFDPVRSGFLVIAVFAGNVMMKPMTTPILRWFGFKKVLIVNGVVNGLSIIACAFITATTPVVVVIAMLFVGGLTRSMQFTAFNTLAFADVGESEMSGANTLFSAAFQTTWGLGVALGAIAVHLSRGLLPILGIEGPSGIDFRIAFLFVALASCIGIVDCLHLDSAAGDHVARPKKR